METDVMRGAHVLVTGAGMGMGRLFALRAAREGAAHVLLWDVDEAALSKVANELRALGVGVLPACVDVADGEAVHRAAREAEAAMGGPLDVLVNNAGIVRGNGYFWETRDADTQLTLAVNTLAPMRVARAFLPGMIGEPARERRILNIASAAALVSNPRMSVYAASKWAMLGWSDSLRLELEQAGHRHLKVTTFCPSYIATGMFEGAKGPLLTPIMTPEQAVDAAWRAMLAGKPQLLKPWTSHLGKVLKGLLPLPLWDAVAGKVFGVYHSMDRFTGRR